MTPERAKHHLDKGGFDGGDLYPIPPYFATGEAIVDAAIEAAGLTLLRPDPMLVPATTSTSKPGSVQHTEAIGRSSTSQ